MAKIIPNKELEAFMNTVGWSSEKKLPRPKEPTLRASESTKSTFTIDDLIKRGKPFYNEEQKDGAYIGVARSLQEAGEHAGVEGMVASLPYLVAGKATANKKSYLWKDWFTGFSEEDVGIDKKGILVPKGKPVVLSIHGGGILTAERILKAYKEGLTDQNAASFEDDEFDNLLEGILPSGERINLYSVEDVKNNRIPNPFGRYGVFMDFETAKATNSGYFNKEDFTANPLVLARVGTVEFLDKYFDKAKFSDGTVGNHHMLNEIDSAKPQGRVLFLYSDDGGLDGNYILNYIGRFVGVAPKAPRAKK